MLLCMFACIHVYKTLTLYINKKIIVKKLSQADCMCFSGSPGSNITPADESPSGACDADMVTKLCYLLWLYVYAVYSILKVVEIVSVI